MSHGHDKAHIAPHEAPVTNAEPPLHFRPLHDRVLVKREKPEEVSRGGIIIPDSVQEKSGEATVMAVGTGKILANGTVVPPSVKKGDVVYLSKHSLRDIPIDGKTYGVVRDEDIDGVKES